MATASAHWTITAGSGGGFTGMTNGYTLLSSGDVLKFSGMNGNRDGAKKIGSVKADEAEKYATRLSDAGFWTSAINGSGNMTMFIEMQKDSMRHQIQWGGAVPAQQFGQLYSDFMTMCSALDK